MLPEVEVFLGDVPITAYETPGGQAFADKIRGLNLEQILCVSLDISKYFQVVMIHNALGEIVKPTFEIDIFKTGLEQLCQAIDEAIESLEMESPQCGQVVKLRFFAGLSIDETAAAMRISASTVKRHWAYARAWLFDALREEDPPSPA